MWCFFFSSRRRHTRLQGDWSSDVCSSDLPTIGATQNSQSCSTVLAVEILESGPLCEGKRQSRRSTEAPPGKPRVYVQALPRSGAERRRNTMIVYLLIRIRSAANLSS